MLVVNSIMDQIYLDILSGQICPYCSERTEYIDSEEIYGKSYGMIYICRPCDAYVGVYDGTDKALGRLANASLRYWKREAHKNFDGLWQIKMQKGFNKWQARTAAYKWLSTALNIEPQFTHIGMFDEEQCKKVVDLCFPYLYRYTEKLRDKERKERQKKYEQKSSNN